MIDDPLISDRQNFVVHIMLIGSSSPDTALQRAALKTQPTGWTYHRTSPHNLTGLKPAEIAFHGKTGTAIVSVYLKHDLLLPEHIQITGCHSPFSAIKRVVQQQEESQ